MKTRTAVGEGANEAGFASIVIALVIIMILSLVTVGFAILMSNNQKQALNRQLSTQAYYAAESGINSAAKAISAGYATNKTTCDPLSTSDTEAGAQYLTNNQVSGANQTTDASFPCLLINQTPASIEVSPLETGQSRTYEVEGVDTSGTPQTISQISISWQDPYGATNFTTDCSKFNPLTGGAGNNNWNAPGVLQAELVSVGNNSGTQLTRGDLISNSLTAFLCPNSHTSTAGTTVNGTLDFPTYNNGSSNGVNNGPVAGGDCYNSASAAGSQYYTQDCNVNITGLGALGQSTYFLNLSSLYKATSVEVTAWTCDFVHTNNCTPLDIAGAQVVIDSTGQAQNVLRRIQVRMPVHSNYTTGISAQNICKELSIMPLSAGPSSRGGGAVPTACSSAN